MLEMDSRDEVVMKSENQEAGQDLGELGRIIHKDLRQRRNKATDNCN